MKLHMVLFKPGVLGENVLVFSKRFFTLNPVMYTIMYLVQKTSANSIIIFKLGN